MADAIGVITKKLTLLAKKFGGDQKVLTALLKIKTSNATANDIKIVRMFFRTLYYQSSLVGYATQATLTNSTLSGFGSEAAVKYALEHGDEITDKLIENLPHGDDDTIPRLRTFVEDSALREGFAVGQGMSATEHKLGFKKFIRLREPRVGPKREHSILEGKVIPRDAKFTLPDGQKCTSPHDWTISNPAFHWVNCYHSIIYVQGVRASELSREN